MTNGFGAWVDAAARWADTTRPPVAGTSRGRDVTRAAWRASSLPLGVDADHRPGGVGEAEPVAVPAGGGTPQNDRDTIKRLTTPELWQLIEHPEYVARQ